MTIYKINKNFRVLCLLNWNTFIPQYTIDGTQWFYFLYEDGTHITTDSLYGAMLHQLAVAK